MCFRPNFHCLGRVGRPTSHQNIRFVNYAYNLNEWLDYNEQKINTHSYQVAWQGVACLEHYFLQIWDTLL